jgi:hypothetical protein
MTGFDPHLIGEIRLGDVLIAVQRYQRSVAYGDCVSAEREGFGHVGAVSNATGID